MKNDFVIKLGIPMEKQFKRLAEILMNQSILNIGVDQLRIYEIEFYCFWKGLHDDGYTHRNRRQLESGKWYFHRTKNDKLKGGNRKGLDVAAGNGEGYCGILLRGVIQIDEASEVIYGPSNLVKHILLKTGENELEIEGSDAFCKKECGLYISEAALKRQDVYSAPRVGLSDKYPGFKERYYRYFIFPELPHKGKEGIMEIWQKNGSYANPQILGIFGRENFTKRANET